MPTYTSVDGVSRELTAWPVCIDGVQREHAQLCAGIDGVQREIFSGMHVWERHAVEMYVASNAATKTVQTTMSRDSDGDYDTGAYTAIASPSDVFADGDILAVNAQFSAQYVSRGTTQTGTTTRLMILSADRISIGYSSAKATTIYQVGVPNATIPSGIGDGKAVLWNVIRTLTVGKRKGSLVDQIESKNPNAYPVNGISGDYWYVKIK